MRTNSRGIDEQLCWWSASIGQGVEYPAPDAFVGPTLEAVVERLSRTVGSGCIHPAPTTLDDVDDAADHSSIIYARLAAGVGRKMRLQLRELPIAQPEMISIHHVSLSEAVNHKPEAVPTLLWVRALNRPQSEGLSGNGQGKPYSCVSPINSAAVIMQPRRYRTPPTFRSAL
jgi:hypothetical protein